MTTLLFGGGGIAEGIRALLGGTDPLVDVRDAEAVLRAVCAAEPDLVVNCAGVSYVSDVEWSDPYPWTEDIAVNLVGSYHVARACVRAGVRTQVYIASVAGLHGKPNHSSYCASKAGVISLVQSLAFEGHNAYAISPGRVDTPMRQRDYPDDTPGSRLDPSDIAGVVEKIIEGRFEPGDNLIIRKVGLEAIVREIDRGEPWREKLRIGEPVTI